MNKQNIVKNDDNTITIWINEIRRIEYNLFSGLIRDQYSFYKKCVNQFLNKLQKSILIDNDFIYVNIVSFVVYLLAIKKHSDNKKIENSLSITKAARKMNLCAQFVNDTSIL